jgi:hypothetical protein
MYFLNFEGRYCEGHFGNYPYFARMLNVINIQYIIKTIQNHHQ